MSLYQLTFTVVASIYNKKADSYALKQVPAEMPTFSTSQEKDLYEDSITKQRKKFRRRFVDSMSKETVMNLGIMKYDLGKVRSNQLNLGLDLKGGMSVIMQVDVEDVIRGLAYNNPDPTFQKALRMARDRQKESTSDYITLFGQSFSELDADAQLAAIFAHLEKFQDRIDYEATNSEVLEIIRSESDAAVENTFNVIRARIDQFGVAQPNISLQANTGRIIVELPGVDDPNRVRKILQSAAELAFWKTFENSEVIQSFIQANDVLKTIMSVEESEDDSLAVEETVEEVATIDTIADDSLGIYAIDSLASDTSGGLDAFSGSDTSGTDELGEDAFNPLFEVMSLNITNEGQAIEGPIVAFVLGRDTSKVNEYLAYEQVKAVFRKDLDLLWSAKPYSDEDDIFMLYAIKVDNPIEKEPALSGDVITDARQEFDEYGRPSVGLYMNSQGASTWQRLTREAAEDPSVKKSVAIILDNRVFSAPRVLQEISGGRSQITGVELDEATDLSNILKAGKLEAKAKIIEEEVVGPSLGAESVRNGLYSLLFGLALVLVFMIFYYGGSGFVSNIALFLNLFFIIGTLASLGAALTLPGIAGIVLTIGMAVDANVIIFERVREELSRGKGPRLALTDGFRNSYSAIIDANVTTLITAAILLTFGLGPVKGFATVLCIGIISSFFTAVMFSRVIFDFFLAKEKSVSFYTKLTKGAFKNININFLDRRKMTYTISGIIIVLGLASILFRGFELGVDFKGGRNYVIEFDQSVEATAVEERLNAQFAGTNTLVKTYGGNRQVQVTTPYLTDSSGAGVDSFIEARLFAGVVDLFADKPGFNEFRTTNIKSSIKVESVIADDIRVSAIWATIFGSLGIFIYLLVRFRKWQFGAGALTAILHDVLIILSIFSIGYGFLPFSIEINQAFVAALLTVIGYSINDTVVVYDRIREYMNLHPTTDLKTNVNAAINSTLSRTLITSFTTLLVVLVLFIFGGEVIRGFSFALLIGVIVGTYSSVFIASPVTVDLLNLEAKKTKV